MINVTHPIPKSVALALAVLLGKPAALHAQAGMPANCTPQMTVQSKSCGVTNHYNCIGTAYSRFKYSYDCSGGLRFVQVLNDQYQSMRNFYPDKKGDRTTGFVIDLAPNAPAPLSLSELISTGRNDFEYEYRNDEPEVVIHYRGFDELTGAQTEIDGILMDIHGVSKMLGNWGKMDSYTNHRC